MFDRYFTFTFCRKRRGISHDGPHSPVASVTAGCFQCSVCLGNIVVADWFGFITMGNAHNRDTEKWLVNTDGTCEVLQVEDCPCLHLR